MVTTESAPTCKIAILLDAIINYLLFFKARQRMSCDYYDYHKIILWDSVLLYGFFYYNGWNNTTI